MCSDWNLQTSAIQAGNIKTEMDVSQAAWTSFCTLLNGAIEVDIWTEFF